MLGSSLPRKLPPAAVLNEEFGDSNFEGHGLSGLLVDKVVSPRIRNRDIVIARLDLLDDQVYVQMGDVLELVAERLALTLRERHVQRSEPIEVACLMRGTIFLQHLACGRFGVGGGVLRVRDAGQ